MITLPEERVLKTLDPPPDDVNEWPDFTLTNVKIFYQGKSRYADLLEASEEVPLCVLGELVTLDDEQEELALIDESAGARIKIDNVTNYSFGQNDAGQPVVWAAGKAGWYEIIPSQRYLSHYNDTVEAIDLFYFMVDQYQKLPQKRRRLGFQIDPFLTAYQKHTDYRIDDDDEAMETLHKHHKFLLKQMVEEREDIDWSQTHLWGHLSDTYPEVVEGLKVNLMQSQNGVDEENEEEQEEEEGDEEVEEEDEAEDDDDQEEDVDEDEVDMEADTSNAEPGEDEREEDATKNIDWTRPIWDLLNKLRKSPNFNIRHSGVEQVAAEFVKLTDFPGNHKSAVAAIERSAEPLLKLMNEAKLRKKFNWSTRQIYDELEATLADEIADDTIRIKTPANKPDKRHRQKSVLRPSGASKGRKRTQGSEDSDPDIEMREPPTSSAPKAKSLKESRGMRADTVDTTFSLEDSPSRQLNGRDLYGLPELPPAPEAQEMLDLVAKEAKMTGRLHQTSHLEKFLGQWVV